MLSFDASPQEIIVIGRIIDRAEKEMNLAGQIGYERINLSMDITACHCNGCKLDLAKLLNAPAFSFSHDIAGISKKYQPRDRRDRKLFPSSLNKIICLHDKDIKT